MMGKYCVVINALRKKHHIGLSNREICHGILIDVMYGLNKEVVLD